MPENTPYVIPVSGVTAGQLTNSWEAPRSGGRKHAGIDIFAPEGTPAVASVSGEVVRAGNDGGKAGNRVWIKGTDGRYYFYAHLSSINVQVGQQVSAGQTVGGVGRTGNARTTPPHLHFSVNSTPYSEDGKINPYQLLTGGKTVTGSPIPAGQAQYSDERYQPEEAAVPPSGEQMLASLFDTYADIVSGGSRLDYRDITAASEQDIEPIRPVDEDDDGDEQTPGTRPTFDEKVAGGRV